MYWEVLMSGDNYYCLQTFSIAFNRRSWYYLKLKRKQTIDQGVYNSIDSEDRLQFAELWTSRKNKEGYLYLVNPFGSAGKIMLERSSQISDLREILDQS